MWSTVSLHQVVVTYLSAKQPRETTLLLGLSKYLLLDLQKLLASLHIPDLSTETPSKDQLFSKCNHTLTPWINNVTCTVTVFNIETVIRVFGSMWVCTVNKVHCEALTLMAVSCRKSWLQARHLQNRNHHFSNDNCSLSLSLSLSLINTHSHATIAYTHMWHVLCNSWEKD